MNSINFCHIAPTSMLDVTLNQTHHLLLAHIIEVDDAYADFYKQLKTEHPEVVYIMDNGGFEMYKAGKPMMDSDKLIELAGKVDADYIVMSDYPGEDYAKTIKSAEESAQKIQDAGYGTFFVPQSEVGDIDGLVESFRWASENHRIDYIGVSILAVPNAYGVEKDNNLQRYLSRLTFMDKLHEEGILRKIRSSNKYVHFLGMVDGPNEIKLVEKYHDVIDTWDSSTAVWAGINDKIYDDSPTGLIDGKIESEVDFSMKRPGPMIVDTVKYNMEIVDALCDPQRVFRHQEGEIVEELYRYIEDTYGQHYSNDDIDTFDVWDSIGMSKEACQTTALKYLMRFGKKRGHNKGDLMKAMHYIVMLNYYHFRKV